MSDERVMKVYILDEFEVIGEYLMIQQKELKAYASENFALAMPEFDVITNRNTDDDSFPYSIHVLVESSVKTLHRDRWNLSLDDMNVLRNLYEDLPKSFLSDGKYNRINETSVVMTEDTLEMMTDIAWFFKNANITIPYSIRKSIAAPKVWGTVAMMYVAHFVLAEEPEKVL